MVVAVGLGVTVAGGLGVTVAVCLWVAVVVAAVVHGDVRDQLGRISIED